MPRCYTGQRWYVRLCCPKLWEEDFPTFQDNKCLRGLNGNKPSSTVISRSRIHPSLDVSFLVSFRADSSHLAGALITRELLITVDVRRLFILKARPRKHVSRRDVIVLLLFLDRLFRFSRTQRLGPDVSALVFARLVASRGLRLKNLWKVARYNFPELRRQHSTSDQSICSRRSLTYHFSILRAVLADRGADHNFLDVGELLSAFLLELCQIPLANEDQIRNSTLLLLLP
jgi:hypothetical protein